MKKHSSPNLTIRQTFWFGWKLVIILSVSLCVLALLRLQRSQSQLSSSSSSSSSSSYILSRRSRIPVEFYGNPKIAFLFLTRQNLPLDFLWQTFFEDAEVANFSIYIHSEPGFVFDESTTRSALFYNRQLSNSIKVGWGESSMIEAERLLLGEALGDPANQRFVLLSDSCVPLYNFSYIYKYMMASPKSFVDSFLDKKEGRYNPKMSPVIPKSKWRKGSQWIALVRKHAEVVVDDEKILPVFKKFCKRRPPLDASKGKQNSMSELVNQKSSVQGKVPSGYFNAMFDLTGAWLNDAVDANHLAFDGYFISLYYLHLITSPLIFICVLLVFRIIISNVLQRKIM